MFRVTRAIPRRVATVGLRPAVRPFSMTIARRAQNDSLGTKVKKGAKWSVSAAIVLAALGVTTVSIYLVFKQLLSPSGETSTFNRVVNMIEKDPGALDLLGYSQEEIDKGGIKLKAYGDVPNDRWSRERPVQATEYTAKDGQEHLLMRFFVESNSTVGVVKVEAINDANMVDQKLIYVILEVKGKAPYYLVGHPQVSTYQRPYSLFGTKDSGFLGVKWGTKKENEKSAAPTEPKASN